MKMRMRRVTLGLVLWAAQAWADSPLTSIDLGEAYAKDPAVKAARAQQLEPVLSFLSGGGDDGVKLAVMTALPWDTDAATPFIEFVAQQAMKPVEQLRAEDLSPSQLFVFGFLTARVHYDGLGALVPSSRDVRGLKPAEALERAARKLPDDFAVQYARALVKAQAAMDKSWCDVFRAPDQVVRAFPAKTRNLNAAALEIATGYLGAYEEECPGSKAAQRKAHDELNQIYSLSKVGAQVVAGTQGGVVVWDPSSPNKPLATHDGFICQGLSLRDVAWLGCEKEVVRWDGARFSVFLPQTKKGEYFNPMRGPDGQLWVRRGAKTWRFDEKAGQFVVAKLPWHVDPYDAVFFEGAWFGIDFMKGLRVGDALVGLQSERYPGSDPRHFTVDVEGHLWVQDFVDGLFRLEGDRFVKQRGLSEKGSGVAVDPDRKLRVLLHYTKGVLVQREGRADQWVELSVLQNMRDVLYDQGSGEVWVAGWGQLRRLVPDGAGWKQTTFVAP